MQINIRDIIELAGYEILSEVVIECKKRLDDIFVFKLKFTKERVARMSTHISSTGGHYDYDITGEFTVYVDEVGCDGEGIIYIVLNTLETPDSPSECWDIVGYGEEI